MSKCKIKLIETSGDPTGHTALELKTIIHNIIDKGIGNILVNMEQVRRIDGVGIGIFENLLERGVEIRLFNVGIEVRSFITITGNEKIVKIIINESSEEAALAMFEKQLMERPAGQGVESRRFARASVSLPTEFKYHPASNGVISGRAHIINLSEGGLGMHKIESFEMHTGRQVETTALKNQKLYDMKFSLNGNKKGVETHGECVREMGTNGNHNAGICFQAMNREARENIRSYVSEVIGSGF